MKSIWTRFGNLFLNLKIQKKLFLLISFILALCFVFTLLVQQYAFHIYDEQIYEKSSQVLNVSSTSIENELHKMERLSYTIMADSQIQQYLRS